MKQEKVKKLLSLVFQAVFIITVFICALNIARSRPSNEIFVNKYATSDVVYADGTSAHFDSKNFGTVNKGDVAAVHIRLPEKPLRDQPTLCFYIYHSVTEIWCGDTLLDAYGADIDARGDMVGNKRFLVPLPDEAMDGEVTIILRATEDKAFNQIKNLKLYSARDAYQYYIDADPISFAVSIPLFFLGCVALMAMLFAGRYNSQWRKGAYIALFAVLISAWMMGSKGLPAMFGLAGYGTSIMEFIAVFTVATPVLLYAYESERKGVFRTVLLSAALVNVAFFALATILNFANVLHYSATLLLSNLLTFASGLLLLVFAVRMKKRGGASENIFFNGMFVLFFTGLYELFKMNGRKFFAVLYDVSLPGILPLGIATFLTYAVISYIREFKETQRNTLMVQIKADTLDKMVATVPAGICQLVPDENLTIVAANDIFYRIMGYRETELAQGKPKDIFLHLLDAEKRFISVKMDELLHSPDHMGEFEFSTVNIDNEPITVLIRYYYDKSGSGNVTVNIVDITDRKRTEEQLRVSEERYRLALSQSGKVFFFFDVPSRTMRLSDELAQAFGLPNVVDNMPENFISQGLVEPQSVETYRRFYERIIAGEPSGDAVISCHMRGAPEQVLWYRIAFTSVFDANKVPQSAIVTYEDLQEQRARELAGAWKQLNLLSVPEAKYVIAEYNLTQNRLLSQVGGLFAKLPEFVTGYDEINAFVIEHFIYEEDVPAYRRFLDRARVLALFEAGEAEDSIEYRSLQSGSTPRWTSTSIQMIRDPYSGDVLAQMLFMDIHAEKVGQIEMEQNVEELKKELESSRIKVMINQMQPHFLYNALSAIQTIVKTDPDYAYRLIYDFTVHLRSSIKALSSDAPIPFGDELKNIKAYLNIEQMRFGDSLKVKYEIDCDRFSVIPLSIQPLAENAARHGVYPKGDEGGTVTVRTYETATAFVVEVEDDGVGFDANAVLHSQGDSVGLKSLIFRLKSLMSADVSIASKPGAGTRVTVTIPKKEA